MNTQSITTTISQCKNICKNIFVFLYISFPDERNNPSFSKKSDTHEAHNQHLILKINNHLVI
jgi:hypothetical protein